MAIARTIITNPTRLISLHPKLSRRDIMNPHNLAPNGYAVQSRRISISNSYGDVQPRMQIPRNLNNHRSRMACCTLRHPTLHGQSSVTCRDCIFPSFEFSAYSSHREVRRMDRSRNSQRHIEHKRKIDRRFSTTGHCTIERRTELADTLGLFTLELTTWRIVTE